MTIAAITIIALLLFLARHAVQRARDRAAYRAAIPQGGSAADDCYVSITGDEQ